MKVVIIGMGPAGMMAAIKAAENGNDVCIIEKNKEAGKKLNITGKGRCNISFVGDKEYFLNNVVTNPKFMLSAINSLDNKALIDYINSLGVKTKEERGNRIFLASDKACELTNALLKELKKKPVNIKYNLKVCEVVTGENKVKGVKLDTGEIIKADKVIIATGGKSYMATGSTGDGYLIAKKLGHSIIDIKPALVPLVLKEKNICKSLMGVTLRNVKLKVFVENKLYDEHFGEMLFTSKGITGPIVLSSSSKLNKINTQELTKDNKIKITIDLKPALSFDELYKRITKDFSKYSNKEFKNAMNDLTIQSLIPIIIQKSGISEKTKANSITKVEKERLTNLFKNFEFTLDRLEDVNVGIVTSGGINTKEINPKTMESKLISGLYFAGEIIDVDALTGGFNLQIAFSTGYVAGNNI